MNQLKPILLDLGLLHEVNDVFLKVISAIRQAMQAGSEEVAGAARGYEEMRSMTGSRTPYHSWR